MNAAARSVEGNANAPLLYIALELRNTAWKRVMFVGEPLAFVVAETGNPARGAVAGAAIDER